MKNLLCTLLFFLLFACGEERGPTTRGENTPGNFVPTNIGSGPDYSGEPQLALPPAPNQGGGNDSPGEENSGDGEDTVETTLSPSAGELPQEGEWTVSTFNVTADTCGIGEDLSFSSLMISHEENETFNIMVDPGEGGTFSCSTDGSTFNCIPNIMELPPEGGMDAALTSTLTLSGELDSSSSLTAKLGGAYECAGADCNAMGINFPCAMSIDLVASAD